MLRMRLEGDSSSSLIKSREVHNWQLELRVMDSGTKFETWHGDTRKSLLTACMLVTVGSQVRKWDLVPDINMVSSFEEHA
jgi:hypothetical protein